MKDRYTQIILTVIALLLAGDLYLKIQAMQPVEAVSEGMSKPTEGLPVRIVGIDLKSLPVRVGNTVSVEAWSTIPVSVDNVVSVEVENTVGVEVENTVEVETSILSPLDVTASGPLPVDVMGFVNVMGPVDVMGTVRCLSSSY